MRLSLVLATLLLTLTPLARAAQEDRLFYEIRVTAPGTPAQGWRGMLLGPDGHEHAMVPGSTLSTNQGDFIAVPCIAPWVPCGAINADQLLWMQSHGGNVRVDTGSWTWRLHVSAECSRSQGWRSELLHNGRPVAGRARNLQTPMGPFRHTASNMPWGSNGWFPASWRPAVIAPGRWPCTP